MPLAPKLAATTLVAATVATLSVLSTPAYADSSSPSSDDGGGSNVQELVNTAESTIFKCRTIDTYNVPIIGSGDVEICVAPPAP